MHIVPLLRRSSRCSEERPNRRAVQQRNEPHEVPADGRGPSQVIRSVGPTCVGCESCGVTGIRGLPERSCAIDESINPGSRRNCVRGRCPRVRWLGCQCRGGSSPSSHCALCAGTPRRRGGPGSSRHRGASLGSTSGASKKTDSPCRTQAHQARLPCAGVSLVAQYWRIVRMTSVNCPKSTGLSM